MANTIDNSRVVNGTRKIYVRDLNPHITCNLCNGYLIEATTLVDCLHVFCRACILRYFENSKIGCPICNTVYKKMNFPCFRPDPIIQALVYKLVPGLYGKEVQQRDDFYRSTSIRASSSCSEDSVIADLSQEHEEWKSSNIDDHPRYFSPDDSVSLSLEYYQPHLDSSLTNRARTNRPSAESDNKTIGADNQVAVVQIDLTDDKSENKENDSEGGKLTNKAEKSVTESETNSAETNNCETDCVRKRDVRYLRCPAAVKMSHLQKFVRMKYALGMEHKVDIIYSGEVLPENFSLMDVAYSFNWKRLKPMKFYYRIFTPTKIQPLKIVKTTYYEGEKQLKVVPVKETPGLLTPTIEENRETSVSEANKAETDAEKQNNINKENLLAQLNLKSRAKLEQEKSAIAYSKAASVVSKNVSFNLKLPNPKPSSKDLNSKYFNSKATSSKDLTASKFATNKVENKSLSNENHAKPEKIKKHYDVSDEITTYEPDDIDQKLSKLYENHKELKKVDEAKAHRMKSPRHPADKNPNLIYSKSNSEAPKTANDGNNCVYEYEDRDEDELRKFAEKRDREWALQKQKDEEEEKHRSNKKRKKSKHSKSGDFVHKKRKLHAEITSNESLNKEEPLKLKVKLTPHNGHKHKHHKVHQGNSSSESVSAKQNEQLSSKEKLLQMRQVRHKHITVSEKEKQVRDQIEGPNSIPDGNIVEKGTQSTENVTDTPRIKLAGDTKTITAKICGIQTVNNNNKNKEVGDINKATVLNTKTLRSDFPNKVDIGIKLPTVQLQKNEQIERQVQKTYLKTFQSYTEKLAESVAQKADMTKIVNRSASQTNCKSALERKIANLHQHPKNIQPRLMNVNKINTIESKLKPQQSNCNNVDKKVTSVIEKPTILNSQFSTGFTVSKIEAGTKRKQESTEEENDKRPCLEITLISPPVTNNSPSLMQKSKTATTEAKPGTKRPPPATIPLERIKKSINLKSGVSIIPKIPESQGPLDLSNPYRYPEVISTRPNGISSPAGSPKTQPPSGSPKTDQEGIKTDKNMQLSNLQMLSKVALEHSNINKSPMPTLLNISKKPPLPSLQNIKVPVPQQNSAVVKSNNLARLPKLNEINKNMFRMMSPQMRNMRPNQNQNIRNIPNPSLLVRQQSQNRLNSISSTAQNCNGKSSENGAKSNGNDGKVLVASKNEEKIEEKKETIKPTTEKINNEENKESTVNVEEKESS